MHIKYIFCSILLIAFYIAYILGKSAKKIVLSHNKFIKDKYHLGENPKDEDFKHCENIEEDFETSHVDHLTENEYFLIKNKAIEVFGTEELAFVWLESPNEIIKGKPIEKSFKQLIKVLSDIKKI